MKKAWWAGALLVCGMVEAPGGQKAVAPPPKPTDSGPSLADTMTFIQQKLSEIGKVNFALYIHDNANGNDWILQRSLETSKLRSDPASCTVNFHFKVASNGSTDVEVDSGIPFRESEDVIVLPEEQVIKELDAKAGVPTRSYRSDPAIFVLRVRRKQGSYNEFLFYDQELADRVAKAMVHAIELCGGGRKDPF